MLPLLVDGRLQRSQRRRHIARPNEKARSQQNTRNHSLNLSHLALFLDMRNYARSCHSWSVGCFCLESARCRARSSSSACTPTAPLSHRYPRWCPNPYPCTGGPAKVSHKYAGGGLPHRPTTPRGDIPQSAARAHWKTATLEVESMAYAHSLVVRHPWGRVRLRGGM
jgi:hypothetical protein